MANVILIDLDKEETFPQMISNQDLIDIKRNGRIIVKNSVLENIDTLKEEELRYVLENFKDYISDTTTSGYIPSAATMKVLFELAPEFKVRFKTEKQGADKIIPISSEEFFEGEKIFQEILNGMNPEWNELQKYKYLYNKSCQMLSYDLNLLSYTEYSKIHENYSRNIFTAMLKNWGVCASFAASFDYLCYRAGLESLVLSEESHDYVTIEPSELENLLTDPTADAVRLKFGMKSKNFGVSKEQFIEDGHHLEVTEASDYEFDYLDNEQIRKLDIETGYLNEFGGEYTDEYIKNLGNNLEGNSNFEKIIDFLERIKNIRSVGRPSTCDFEMIMNLILSESKDKEFVDGVKIYNFVSENIPELPRQIAVEVHDKINQEVQYYVLKNGLDSYELVDQIGEETGYKSR